MGPPSYMQSVIDHNVVMQRMTVYKHSSVSILQCLILALYKGQNMSHVIIQ